MLKGVLLGVLGTICVAAVGAGGAWAYLTYAGFQPAQDGERARTAPVDLNELHPRTLVLEEGAAGDNGALRYYANLFVSADLGQTEELPAFTLSQYEDTLSRIATTYPGNSMIQIGEGIETIYRAQTYWPDLTYLRCMGYVTDGVPDEVVATYSGQTTTDFDTTRTVGGGVGPEGASSAAQERFSGTTHSSTFGTSRQFSQQSDIMSDCETIYGWLEYEYYRPQLEAAAADAARQQALQETIQQNQEAARSRAQQEMAQKAEQRRQAIEDMYRRGQYVAEIGRRHEEQVRQRRIRDGY